MSVIEKRRSIHLSAFEADLLCVTGAPEAVMIAMVKEEKRRAFARLADRGNMAAGSTD